MKYIIAAEEKNSKENNKNKSLKWFEYLYLIAIYYYSFSTLNSSIVTHNGNQNPIIFGEYLPFLTQLMEIENNAHSVTDKSIFLYFILIDIIKRPIIPFSKIVKFNIILSFLIEFSFLIVSTGSEIFLLKDVKNSQFKNSKSIHDVFYSIVWVVYVAIYLYCAFFAFQKKYPKFFKPFDKITPSILLYLNIEKKETL